MCLKFKECKHWVDYELKLNQEFKNRSYKSNICKVSQALKFIFTKQIILKFKKKIKETYFSFWIKRMNFHNKTKTNIFLNYKIALRVYFFISLQSYIREPQPSSTSFFAFKPLNDIKLTFYITNIAFRCGYCSNNTLRQKFWITQMCYSIKIINFFHSLKAFLNYITLTFSFFIIIY